MQPLTKKEIKAIAHRCSPIDNYYFSREPLNPHMKVVFWHPPKATTREEWKLLDERLWKHDYEPTYEFHNATWGYRYDDKTTVIVYCSKRGLGVEVSNKVSQSKAEKILVELGDRIVKYPSNWHLMKRYYNKAKKNAPIAPTRGIPGGE